MQNRWHQIWTREYSNECRKNSTFPNFKDYSLWKHKWKNRSMLRADHRISSTYRKACTLNIFVMCLFTEENCKREITPKALQKGQLIFIKRISVQTWTSSSLTHKFFSESNSTMICLVYFTYFSLNPHIWAFKLLIASPLLYIRLELEHTSDAVLHI